MESENDRKYPSYGQYGDPKRSADGVCMWCGKEEVTWQLSWLMCSHRCHAAIHLETYKMFRLVLSIIPILAVILVFLNTLLAYEFLIIILLSFSLTLMIGFWIYSIWMVRAGTIMRDKSDSFEKANETENSG